MSRQIILDTETTGLETKDGHRIIEVGAIELMNRRFTGRQLHYYFNPDRLVDEGAMAVHGISNEFLADKPRFHQVIDEFIAFVDGAELVIHNAAFDIGFINHELRLANHKTNNITHLCEVVDTLIMARQLHPGQKNSLDALCKRYNINNSHRKLHGALLDADILGRVYLAMTGGQSNLFDEEESALEKNSQTMVVENTAQSQYAAHDFAMLAATEEELSAHAAFLELLRKKNNGTCLWD